MTEQAHITSVRFHRYKAFRDYSVSLQSFNVLVGPNNCGKSTILGAFRILAEGMRIANSRNPVVVPGPDGEERGYSIPLQDIPVATENVFYDYDDSQPATVRFRVSNGNELLLFFPESGRCFLICNTHGKPVTSTSSFRSSFNFSVGFVPVLGPVEHNEPLYQKEAARMALLTHRAARNFRNIWYHYPEDFEKFRALIKSTWPGMDIEKPEVDVSHEKSLLRMFCPEERIPREIYWAGFGFQVWCQMLTYIIRHQDSALFLIDEPDIYLHDDLQRQLLGILKTLGPDILIATHSTEIITEADPDELVIVNKRLASGKRIKDPSQLQHVFSVLGSNLNPVLTQLGKTKRALFVEGKDFQVLSRFARKLGKNTVANRSDFAVVSVEGFNPTKVRDFAQGIETTLGSKVISGVIFDRDYRSEAECRKELSALKKYTVFAVIHGRKELENFLLVSKPIQRAIESRLQEHNQRTGQSITFGEDVSHIIQAVTEPMRHKIEAKYLARRRPFEKASTPALDESTIDERLMMEFEKSWNDFAQRCLIVPGKEVLAALNTLLQSSYGITISATLVINSFQKADIPEEMVQLINDLEQFRKSQID